MILNKQKLKTFILITLFVIPSTVFATLCEPKKQFEGKTYRNSEFISSLNCTAKRDLTFGYWKGEYVSDISATYKMKCAEKTWANAAVDAYMDTYNIIKYEMLYLDGYNGSKSLKDEINQGEIICHPAGRISFEGRIYEPVQ